MAKLTFVERADRGYYEKATMFRYGLDGRRNDAKDAALEAEFKRDLFEHIGVQDEAKQNAILSMAREMAYLMNSGPTMPMRVIRWAERLAALTK